jgi:hypothetical protein
MYTYLEKEKMILITTNGVFDHIIDLMIIVQIPSLVKEVKEKLNYIPIVN